MTTPDREQEAMTAPAREDEAMTAPVREDEATSGAREDSLDDAGAAPTLVEGSDELFDRWQRAQAGFVDAPRDAVQEAGEIVEDTLGRLRETFGSERDRLEAAWEAGDEPSTEDLRVALRRYRTFFERLLAA